MSNKIGAFGQGIGGPVQSQVTDPSRPTYDPAEEGSSQDAKIQGLFSRPELLTPWEVTFLSECYGAQRLSRKQHITIWSIGKKVGERASQAPKVTP